MEELLKKGKIMNQIKIKKIINSFYEIISGSPGDIRDWARFRSLFYNNAFVTPYVKSDVKKSESKVYSVDSYIDKLSDFLENSDFYECGYNYSINVFSNICQVESDYKASSDRLYKNILKTGRNFIHLIKEGDEWKILSMVWEDNT